MRGNAFKGDILLALWFFNKVAWFVLASNMAANTTFCLCLVKRLNFGHVTIYEPTHFKKMVQVWKAKSLILCLRYDPQIHFRRRNHNFHFHTNDVQGSIQGIWGVEASPQRCAASPKKILLSLRYIGNYIGKIIQTRQGHCKQCNIFQNCVSKCTRLHLSAYSFQKIPGGACPWTSLGSLLPSVNRDLSPKR